MGDEQKENKVKLILVGQPRTGKTAIYNRLLTNTYDANSMTTIAAKILSRHIPQKIKLKLCP